MASRKNDLVEIPEKLKHFGNAKVKKFGVGPGEYISIDGTDVPDHVEEIILDGSGSARADISGWDGRLCILGDLFVNVEGVSDVYLNINNYIFARVENCAQVKAVSNTMLEALHCGNVELFDSTLAEVWYCDEVLAYNRSNVRVAKHSKVALFDRATGKIHQGSVGVLMDSSYVTAYSDAQIKSLSEFASVVHEGTVEVSGEGRFRCIGIEDDEASVFHATREALIRNATPADLFQDEFLVYKTTDADGNSGRLYDKSTHWEPGTTVAIPEMDRDPKNPWLFFSLTLGHAVEQGEDYSDGFRVFLVRIHINDVKRRTNSHLTDMSEIEAWEGEVLTEVKHPTDQLFSVN